MPVHFTPQPAATEGDYEDLMSLWGDLESTLSTLLSRPPQVRDFKTKVLQIDAWLQELVAHDIDAALYLMFQLASTSTVGYSASHALVCGTLCHVMAVELKLPQGERDSLVRAALTMNIGMTQLQNELAEQRDRPSSTQQDVIKSHSVNGQDMLEQLFIRDPLWLEVVGQHHSSISTKTALMDQTPAERLTRILGTIDRYAAMISPRKSRVGRSVTDSVRAILGQEIDQRDEVGLTLVRAIGLCPPGTFVKMDNGEAGIVLRRSDKPNFPLVASLENKTTLRHNMPTLYYTAHRKPHIQSALTRSAVTQELNHRTMVRLGVFASQRAGGRDPLNSKSAGL